MSDSDDTIQGRLLNSEEHATDEAIPSIAYEAHDLIADLTTLLREAAAMPLTDSIFSSWVQRVNSRLADEGL